jgi:hypothetical protein
MDEFRDIFLEMRLKNWAAQKRPANQARSRLLWAAMAQPSSKSSSWKDGYHALDRSPFFPIWIIVSAQTSGLTMSRLLA